MKLKDPVFKASSPEKTFESPDAERAGVQVEITSPETPAAPFATRASPFGSGDSILCYLMGYLLQSIDLSLL